MNMTKETYKKYADARAPRSPVIKDCIRAFGVGGSICTLGQGLTTVFTELCHMPKEDAGTLTAATLILIAAILTGLGIFDRIAKFAGAGTLVPITGFANAVGLILGVGAKIFSVAGPVLLYGTLAGCLYGVVYWIASLF